MLFCRDVILGVNSEKVLSWPKDDGLDEVNEVILLVLSDEPFSSVPSVRQIADSSQDMRSKSWLNCVSSACWFFSFHSQTSDIFIGLLTGSLTVRRQVKSSRVVDPTSRLPVVHPVWRTGWESISHFGESWFHLSRDQSMRWSGCQMEMTSPIRKSAWFRARNWC
jgi:hypothetical protein